MVVKNSKVWKSCIESLLKCHKINLTGYQCSVLSDCITHIQWYFTKLFFRWWMWYNSHISQPFFLQYSAWILIWFVRAGPSLLPEPSRMWLEKASSWCPSEALTTDCTPRTRKSAGLTLNQFTVRASSHLSRWNEIAHNMLGYIKYFNISFLIPYLFLSLWAAV